MKEKGPHHIIDGANHVFGMNIFLRCMWVGKMKDDFVRCKVVVKLIIIVSPRLSHWNCLMVPPK